MIAAMLAPLFIPPSASYTRHQARTKKPL